MIERARGKEQVAETETREQQRDSGGEERKPSEL